MSDSWRGRIARAALFALVGSASLVHWLVSDPTRDTVNAGWAYVLGFSGLLLLVAIGLVTFGLMVEGHWVAQSSLVGGTALALGSVVNVLEDGLGYEWAFWGFVASSAAALLALAAAALSMVATRPGRLRLCALVPAGALAAIVAYVEAGGPLMLAVWVGAAGFALVAKPRVVAAPTST